MKVKICTNEECLLHNVALAGENEDIERCGGCNRLLQPKSFLNSDTRNGLLWYCQGCELWTVRHPETPLFCCPNCGIPMSKTNVDSFINRMVS